MKPTSRIVAGALLLAGTAAFCSGTNSATASANILTSLSLGAGTTLSFGDVTVSASSGTVVIDTNNSRSVTGGVTAAGGTVSSSSFSATGTASHSYTITLPSNTDVTVTSGAKSMTVTNFTSSPSGTGTLDGSGNATITVGAQLNVTGSQAPGTYTGTFNVTVAYN